MVETNRLRAERDEAALGYGLSLHIGNVMFGNVGLAERLSFSVFGSTVNEVARLEGLTKKFATPIVASEEFTSYCGGEWEALGVGTLARRQGADGGVPAGTGGRGAGGGARHPAQPRARLQRRRSGDHAAPGHPGVELGRKLIKRIPSAVEM